MPRLDLQLELARKNLQSAKDAHASWRGHSSGSAALEKAIIYHASEVARLEKALQAAVPHVDR